MGGAEAQESVPGGSGTPGLSRNAFLSQGREGSVRGHGVGGPAVPVVQPSGCRVTPLMVFGVDALGFFELVLED
ncbi:hypothetical protein, partial [Streptomyces poriferorum]|uniref:hypothetical protein n=1 Tax=Streptomyces poriferorum TaxID=2798799 RepID=UPI001C5FC5FA